MMYMYFGDSHSRQFVGTSWGIFSHYVFSGATIKGLANTKSVTGHQQIITHAVSSKTPKTLFFMFGSVDLDFTYAKLCCLSEVDSNLFISTRVDIYCDFLRTLSQTYNDTSKVLVIAPQLSPLKGDNFFVQTAKHINHPEEQLREAASMRALSDVDRCNLVIRFNDQLEKALKERLNIELLRIDKMMLGDDQKIQDVFVPTDPNDHHARIDQTQRLWRPIMKKYTTEHSGVG